MRLQGITIQTTGAYIKYTLSGKYVTLNWLCIIVGDLQKITTLRLSLMKNDAPETRILQIQQKL